MSFAVIGDKANRDLEAAADVIFAFYEQALRALADPRDRLWIASRRSAAHARAARVKERLGRDARRADIAQRS